MPDQTREQFLKNAGRITLGALATGGIVAAPAVIESPDARALATKATHNGHRIIHAARKWLGTPYKHGGRSRHGIDCSMFIKKVYADALGVYVPDSPPAIWSQGYRRRQGVYIGDICCYRENGPNGPITHVAIQERGGQIIHASAYWGKVVESSKHWSGCGFVGNVVWR